MLFNSIEFALFFALFYALYLLSTHRLQNNLILVGSYFFYGSWDWRFLSLILLSTIVDYFCGLKIHTALDENKRKGFLLLSVFVNLSILGFFKYANFFAENFSALMGDLGWNVDPFTLSVVLPVGISFYTFQTMSYSIDIYRRELVPTKRFFDFALFVAFFPQLVAGPIERAKNLLPQVLKERSLTQTQFYEGVWLILWGLFKKIFIADNLAVLVDSVFAPEAELTGMLVAMGVYAFAFQIYCDFSGYSDIARGLAKVMGFEIMLNFRMPYFALNPRDFWRRWHISLSSWLRDYLYISMGGNRGGRWQTQRNLFLTMTLGGLWHGAAWTFVVWGIYHGCVLILHRALEPVLAVIKPKTNLTQAIWKLLRIVAFFHVVCLGWLFFRAQTMGQVAAMLQALFFDFQISGIGIQYAMDILFFVVFLLVVQVCKERKADMYLVHRLPAPLRGTLYLIIVTSILLAGAKGGHEFIYFQF